MNIVFCESDDQTEKYITQRLLGHSVTHLSKTAQEEQIDQATEVLSVFVNSRVDAVVLEGLPKLKLIATRSTGFNHIDLAACKQRGIVVCNVPSYGERTVAEYTFALLLMLSRRLRPALRRIHEEGKFYTDASLQGFDLAEKTLGVIGTGRIGCHVIQIANGFGMHIVAYDPFPKSDLEATCNMKYLPLEQLLAVSDIITIHAPYMPTTHHLLQSENMKNIKRGALLINTARGAIVETRALVGALRSGVLAGAALDVLEEEGYVGEEWKLLGMKTERTQLLEAVLADHQLMTFPNVIITPHNAFNTVEALERILEVSTQNIEAFKNGSTQNVVAPQ